MASSQGAPGSCRYCGTAAYTADAEGPVHTCCSAWRDVIEAGRRCPACEAGAWLRSPEHAGRTMAPLPRFLPGGREFRPDLGLAAAVQPIGRAARIEEPELGG